MKKEQLRTYQNFSVDWIINKPYCGLLLGMGFGKTIITLTAIHELTYYLEIAATLIVAPKRVVESVWAEEAANWDHTKNLKVVKIIGSPGERLKAISTKADIYLISRDNLSWLTELYKTRKPFFDMLVLDESTSFKSHKSLRFKAARFLRNYMRRVVILTGTPVPNGYLDLWPQLYLLDRGDRLGRTRSAYIDNYFAPLQGSGHIVYKYALREFADELINRKIEDICFSLDKTEELSSELPEIIENDIIIPIPETVKKEYKTFEKNNIVSIVGTELTAANAAVLRGKLLQFASGAVYLDDKANYSLEDSFKEIHTLKIEALEEVIEDLNGTPVMVVYDFQHSLKRLQQRFSKRYTTRTLKTKADIDAWNTGQVDILFIHPASGGHGLNLQFGSNQVIWFGPTDNAEYYDQVIARLARPGQKQSTVVVTRLLLQGTFDKLVVDSTAKKINTQEALLQAVMIRRNEYLAEF